MITKKKKIITKKTASAVLGQVKKTASLYRPLILSRHPSHKVLRAKYKNLPLNRFPVVIRFGSTTELNDTRAKGGRRIEINTTQSVRNSANKYLMKQCFNKAGVKTAAWCEASDKDIMNKLQFPIVCKSHYGSRGEGNSLIKSIEEFEKWKKGKTLGGYIIEQYMSYSLEYRLHVTEDGCFYACRKALKEGTADDDKWSRHDDNSVWFLETNPAFNKPNSWNQIVQDCIKALKAVGADVLSFDVKVQGPKDREGRNRKIQEWILLECNSASSMDNGNGAISICAQKYIQEIPKIIERKAKL